MLAAGMIVLALDSSAAACSVAIRDGSGVLLARRCEPMMRGHAELLMPMVRATMAEARVEFAALGLIAATTGPGSFTGIRVGLAAARGLALASGLPVLGITAFDAIANAVPPSGRAGRPLVVAVDSRRGDFFVQAFALDGAALAEPCTVPPERLIDIVPAGDLALAGDGARRAGAVLASLGRPAVLTDAVGPPDAAHVASIALLRWRPGERPPSPLPLYLRAPDVTAPPQFRVPR
jgi:tRNA threonylcarbamoyladenosine biosynthesis protein TsaB